MVLSQAPEARLSPGTLHRVGTSPLNTYLHSKCADKSNKKRLNNAVAGNDRPCGKSGDKGNRGEGGVQTSLQRNKMDSNERFMEVGLNISSYYQW